MINLSVDNYGGGYSDGNGRNTSSYGFDVVGNGHGYRLYEKSDDDYRGNNEGGGYGGFNNDSNSYTFGYGNSYGDSEAGGDGFGYGNSYGDIHGTGDGFNAWGLDSRLPQPVTDDELY